MFTAARRSMEMEPPASSGGWYLPTVGWIVPAAKDMTRFPIAFQIVPLIGAVGPLIDGSSAADMDPGLFFIIWFMPESPRWVSVVVRCSSASNDIC